MTTIKKLMLIGAMTVSASALAGDTVFDGADWIAVDDYNRPLYADYLSVFRLGFHLDHNPDSEVSVLFGMDDPRLMNANLNIYGIQADPGKSYIELKVHQDSVSLIRRGYHPDDREGRLLGSFPVGNFTYDRDSIEVAVNFGHTEIFVNGNKVGYKGINPVGNGGDYLAFPVLGSLSIKNNDHSDVKVSDITVSNFREPRNRIAGIEGEFSTSQRLEWPRRSMPELRRTVMLDPSRQLDRVTARVTARGIYDLYVDGRRVNEEFFLPGSTQYNRTHLYHQFDLTDYFKNGSNEIKVSLGEGWWSGPSTYTGENWNFYGDRQAFSGEFVIEYTDGSVERIVTGPEWEYSVDGPVITAGFFQGEIYDARRDEGSGPRQGDKHSPGDVSRRWHPVAVVSDQSDLAPVAGGWDNVDYRLSFGDRVLAVDTLTAHSVIEPRPGVYLYDMGQNMAGIPHITFKGLKYGDDITIRHGEVLYPDMPQYGENAGMLMTENLRAAMATDHYIAAGGSEEVFCPRQTLHGFRFLEITGIDSPLPVEDVKGIVVSSVNDFNAHFECSDTLINRLWENVKWSMRGNFISLPTDCPQRNERLGWMGDISVFAPSATKMADVSALLRQYLQSVRDCQGEDGRFPDVAPTGFGFGGFLWGSAGITVPWECYLQYRDTTLLAEHYEAMRKYMDYVFRETIDPETGILVQRHAWGDLGDWLSPEYDAVDKSLLWECYLIYDLQIMGKVARILGHDDDAVRYEKEAENRKRFFARIYVDPETQKTRWSAYDKNRQGSPVDTQSSYALPLAMGIYDTPLFRTNFIETIERENRADDGTICPPYSLMTGFIGTAWIMEALSAIDRNDVAYGLLCSKEYPSWLYPVTQGATTVWERLNSYTDKDGFGRNNSMNSFNHYSFGAVANWLLTRCLGIKTDEYGKVSVEPVADPTGRITYARGWIDTPSGRVESSWGNVPD